MKSIEIAFTTRQGTKKVFIAEPVKTIKKPTEARERKIVKKESLPAIKKPVTKTKSELKEITFVNKRGEQKSFKAAVRQGKKLENESKSKM